MKGIRCRTKQILEENRRLRIENARLYENEKFIKLKAILEVLDSLPGWVGVYDLDYTIIGLNNQIVSTFSQQGMSTKEDFIGKKCFELYKGRKSPCPECLFQSVIKTNRSVKRTTTTYEKLITGMIMNFYFIPLTDNNGNIFAVMEMVIDSSDRLNSSIDKNSQMEFLQTLLDAIPSPVYYKDDRGWYIGFNNALERWVNMPKDKIMFHTASEILPPILADTIKEKEETLQKGETVCRFEFDRDFDDGSHGHYLHTKAVYPISPSGHGIIGVITDITEIRHAKDALIKQKNFYERLLDEANIWVDAIDLDGNIILWNKKSEEISGYKKEEILGNQSKWEYVYPDPAIREYFLNLCKQHMRDEQTRKDIETEITTRGGQKRIISWSTNLIRNDFEQVVGTMFLGIDVTERKRMEKKLARLDRLNLVGEMAASIAHEIRNPMTTVKGFLQYLMNKPDQAENASRFEIMIEELDRANTIITEFLTMAKNKLSDFKMSNLNTIISNLLPLLMAEALMSDKQIKTELQHIPELLLDEKEIRQLLMNLCKNGLEATAAGGVVTIRTLLRNNEVELSIHDDGCGIPEKYLDNLGTPFFTTKESGTGLGLAVSYSIINRHNATISIDTSPKGTSFYICFKQSIL